MKIYVASSWRCIHQPGVVMRLRLAGHDVYDFRNPVEGDTGFNWREIDYPDQYIQALELSQKGFEHDMSALREANATILVMPCGRGAHLKLGMAIDKQKTAVLLESKQSYHIRLAAAGHKPMACQACEGVGNCTLWDAPWFEPELMLKAADLITDDIEEIVSWRGAK